MINGPDCNGITLIAIYLNKNVLDHLYFGDLKNIKKWVPKQGRYLVRAFYGANLSIPLLTSTYATDTARLRTSKYTTDIAQYI
jgi:hypothetical protein